MLKLPWMLLFPLAIVGFVALVITGVIPENANLFVAMGVATAAVGLALIFDQSRYAIGMLLLVGGATLWFGHGLLPSLTVADALNFAGVQP